MKASLSSLCWRYISKQKGLFGIAFFFGCVYGVMSGWGLPIIFEKVFRQIFEERESYDALTVCGIAALVPIGFLIRGIFGYLSTVWMNRCGLQVLTELRLDIFKKLQYLPLSFFEKTTTGDLLHRVVSDPKNLQDLLLEMASEFLKQPLQMVAALGSLVYLSMQHGNFFLLLIFLVALPVCFLPVRLLRSCIKNYSRKMQQQEAVVTERVSENLQAAETIRLFQAEEAACDRIRFAMEQWLRDMQLAIQWQKLQQPMMEIVSALVIGVIFVYAYFQKIPFSVFSAMGTALYFAFEPMKKLTNLFGWMQRTTGSLERIVAILNQPVSIDVSVVHPCRETCYGAFTFRDVSFQYEGAEHASLSHINVEIPAKHFYALVGASGAGKSTFVKMLSRLYDTTEGSILLDGIDVRQWDLAFLRQQMAFVSQFVWLFNDTFLNNLRIGNPRATREEVMQAAQQAYAHDFILEAGGYDANIGENGNRFSGGQRQRLAIARAFVKQAPILILDEATSALDSESEYFIKKSIDSIRKQKTIIAIAHRISTIQQADQILVLEQGKLVGQGTHEELLQTNVRYQQFAEKQAIDATKNGKLCSKENL